MTIHQNILVKASEKDSEIIIYTHLVHYSVSSSLTLSFILSSSMTPNQRSIEATFPLATSGVGTPLDFAECWQAAVCWWWWWDEEDDDDEDDEGEAPPVGLVNDDSDPKVETIWLITVLFPSRR